MDDLNYELKHPDYDLIAPDYERNQALYDGGSSMDNEKSAKKYLVQHQWEITEQYNIRVKRAAYRNYAAPTVDLFASSITDGVRRDEIEKVERLAPLLGNCDLVGNSADQFFKAVSTESAAVGASFVLVDMPQATAPASSLKEAKEQGLAPYFVHTPALNVTAWDFDDDGSLAWVKIVSSTLRASGPFSDYEKVKTVTIWAKTYWQRFKSVGEGAYYLDGEGYNPLGMVPLVPFLYEQHKSPMMGRSVIDDVAKLIISVYNQDSELDKMLFDAALPLLVAYGMTTDEAEKLPKATTYLWRFGSQETRVEYVEPSGISFSAKRQKIQDDIESIREISLRQTKPKGAGVESAEAKRLDAVQISSQLADFARNMAAAERRCWEIAGMLAGVDAAALEKINIQYNETFDPESMRENLLAQYREMRRSDTGLISVESIWDVLGWDEERKDTERKRIAKEREQSPSGPFGDWGGI